MRERNTIPVLHQALLKVGRRTDMFVYLATRCFVFVAIVFVLLLLMTSIVLQLKHLIFANGPPQKQCLLVFFFLVAKNCTSDTFDHFSLAFPIDASYTCLGETRSFVLFIGSRSEHVPRKIRYFKAPKCLTHTGTYQVKYTEFQQTVVP